MEDLSGADIDRGAPRVCAALADALKRDRDAYNARFAQARRRWRRLDGGAFAEHLADNLSPIVDAVAAVQPARVDAVVQGLYGLSLQYVARHWLGPKSRQPYLNRLWREQLPKLSSFVAQEPVAVARALTVAARSIGGRSEGERARVWMKRLVEIAAAHPKDCAAFDTVLDVGKVLAWRCGMAQYRASALAVWRGLSDELRYQSLVLSPPDDGALLDVATRPGLDALDAAFANPWFHPARHRPGALRVSEEVPDALSIQSVGGFAGFGYDFHAPPRVIALGEELFAVDGERWFRIFADAFGTSLRAVEPRANDAPRLSDAELARLEKWKSAALALEPNLGDATSAALLPSTLALTVPHSHRVFLVS